MSKDIKYYKYKSGLVICNKIEREKMKFYKSLSFVVVFTIILIGNVSAQNRSDTQASIVGTVLDVNSSQPMEFANIVLFSLPDSVQTTGTVTNSKGLFTLDGIKNGNYFLRISFIGYDAQFINSIQIKNNSKIDMGKIFLAPTAYGVGDVVVSGERAPISYEIDRKVINVGENFAYSSGTAVDILENVPSITVDIEGNVSMRGSGSFTVLIDGRPSVLEASEALQQMPASSIENIEIITNPSAKYNPEGTAGIINIITKKSKDVGLSGIFELNGGLKNKYGTELITDYKSGLFQANFGANYNNRTFFGQQNERNWTNDGIKYSYYNSLGNSNWGMEGYGLRGSISYDLGNKNILTLGGRYGDRSRNNTSHLDYQQWNTLNQVSLDYISASESKRGGSFYSIFGNYIHPFETKGHQISAEIFFRSNNSNEENINRLFEIDRIVSGQITTESGPGRSLETKIDYTLPLWVDTKFEAGLNGEIEYDKEKTGLLNYNPTAGIFELNQLFSHDIDYNNNEIAVYSMFSSKINKFGYQLGFRTEYTGRSIELLGNGEKYSIYRWDYFPSAHMSYEFIPGHQMMTSYTRRINRPGGWELEPFETWIDAYNVRIGNPALLPQYIDSYELGYQTLIGGSVLSLEGYYRVTHNRIERVRSVYSETVTLQSVQNIGKDYALGTELFFNFDPIKNWNVNLMGNLYDYRIDGIINNEPVTRKSFNWNARFNNTLKLTTSTQLQFNVSYNSPSVSSQGRREGFVFTNFAVKQELFDKLLTATLQVRDLFGTAKFEFINESLDFYNYRYSERESPVVMLNLRFNINNYKNNRRGSDEPQGMREESMDE